MNKITCYLICFFLNPAHLNRLAKNDLGSRLNKSIFENKNVIHKTIRKRIRIFFLLVQNSKAIENAYFRHYSVGGVLLCFQALLGVFELTIMGDCYNLYSKDAGFTTSMCLRNFGSNILRVWFKLKNV